MTNREMVLKWIKNKRPEMKALEKAISQKKDLAALLTMCGFDTYFCRGCSIDEEENNCERCAEIWLGKEVERNEKNNHGSGGSGINCSNGGDSGCW